MAAISAMTAMNPSIRAHASDANEKSQPTSAAISANDFLTLLVTEMKNQDPTAQTDPNEYVNQLVQVNSLQQLIEINEKTSAPGAGSGATSGTGKAQAAHAAGGMASIPDPSGAARRTGTTHPIAVAGHPIAALAGNLGIPPADPAAQRVAKALSGRT